MKNKIYYIITVIIILPHIFSGCTRFEYSYSRSRQVIVDNKTKEQLVISGAIGGSKTYDLLSYGNDILKSEICSIFPSKGIGLNENISIHIYNLKDTTNCYYFYDEEIDKYSFTDSLLLQKVEHYEHIYDKKNDIFRSYTITIDNEVLSIMNKDYTMLEKFSEYYK